jgi:hypothetical protein
MAIGVAAIQPDSAGEASRRAVVAVEKAQKIVSNGTLLDFEEKTRSRRYKAGLAVGDADAALATSDRRDRSPSPWEPMIRMGVPHGHLTKAAQISPLA